jgi:hypothetical protein
MATVRELLAKHGIALKHRASGRHYTTYPKCSATRSKAHPSANVLGVTRGGCNHCEWTGPDRLQELRGGGGA